jgi:RNA polymerase sigma-70 factor (ECF subfamily)
VQDIEAGRLALALSGDPRAFTYIVEQFQRPVYNLCYRMLGSAQDAEDAAQETFLRVYKAMHRYDRKRSFSSWLLSIAAHYCIDQLRKRRLNTVSVEELPYPVLPDNSPGMEASLSSKEDRDRIRLVLDTLDPVDRAAIILYYWYDYSYKEICETLSLSMSAVKSRMHRARRAMAKRIMERRPKSLNAERIAV